MTIDIDDIARAARGPMPVLITAPRWHTRDLCARLVHARSGRWNGPFVTLRSGAAPEEGDPAADPMQPLLARHLRLAAGGTLYIDDLARLSGPAQRVLFDVVGCTVGAHAAAAGVRLVTGTGSDLLARVADGRFDAALFYRLNRIHLVEPPALPLPATRPERPVVHGRQTPVRLAG